MFMCVCSTFRSLDSLLFDKNGFVVGVRTLNVTAASATPPLSHCRAWQLCQCHAWIGAINTVQRVKSWTVGGTQAGRGQAITEKGRTVGRREQGRVGEEGREQE